MAEVGLVIYNISQGLQVVSPTRLEVQGGRLGFFLGGGGGLGRTVGHNPALRPNLAGPADICRISISVGISRHLRGFSNIRRYFRASEDVGYRQL